MNNDARASEYALTKFATPIASKIMEGAKKTRTLFFSPSIFRVPKDLRKLNESAYVPSLIAIGPLHSKDEHLQTPMQQVKMHYTDFLLYRVAKVDNREILDTKKGELLKNWAKEMKECVEEAKKCYAEEICDQVETRMKEEEEKEMVEMMLVDGCFILNLLYSSYRRKKKKTLPGGDGGNPKASSNYLQPTNGGEDGSRSGIDPFSRGNMLDPVLDSIMTESVVKQDLLLLENQIPFFVLEKLFELTVARITDANLSLKDYVLWYFGDILTPEDENSGSKKKSFCRFPGDCVLWVSGESGHTDQILKQEESSSNANDRCHHILHLLHGYYGPHDLQNQPGKTELRGFKRKYHSSTFSEYKLSASDLHYIGVNFLPTKENKPFTVEFKQRPDIFRCFSKLEVSIPPLLVHKHTELFLRNLIALEQSNSAIQGAFTTYAKVMGMLVNSEKDVQMLKDVGIIHNYLGTDKDVSDLFNKLSQGVNVQGDYYSACQREIKYYRQHCWPRIMAYWRSLGFGSKWSVIAFVLGMITSVITVAQFVKDFRK